MIKDSGLIPPKKELINLDFSYAKTFGAVRELPQEDFMVAESIEIKDQMDSDMCTAFAATAVSEDQEGVKLAPEWFFAKVKQVIGDYTGYGADPRSACDAAVRFGFLESSYTEHSLTTDSRDSLANWSNWDFGFDIRAIKHRKKSYFKIDGGGDLFDSIRGFLWENKDRKQSVFTGTYWQPEWTFVKDGIASKDSANEPVNAHAFKVAGQKIIEGVPHLVIINSYGYGIGDQGRFYFPREVVNRFLFAYAFMDLPSEAGKLNWNLLQKVKYFIKKLLK